MKSENSSIRIVFMGTPEFSVPTLEALHQKFNVVGVYTQPDRPVGRGQSLRASPVKIHAKKLGLSVFQPDRLTQSGVFEELQALNPDLIVVVAYGQILKKNVLDLPRLGCVNLHSSLLPRWRGAAPMQWAILEGDSETGVSTMYMAEKLDAGDVLLQSKFSISSRDRISDLHDRMMREGAELMVTTVERLIQGDLQGRVQNEKEVTYAKKLTKEMQWLDPSLKAEVLHRRIRALNPWPGTSLCLSTGDRLKVRSAVLRSDIQGKEGEIFEKSGMLLLGTAQGCLELKELQWEGKKPVEVSGFLNGLKGKQKELPLIVVKAEEEK